jgi:hypothetical protein
MLGKQAKLLSAANLREAFMAMHQSSQIPGYRLGAPELGRSPVSLADFELLKNRSCSQTKT